MITKTLPKTKNQEILEKTRTDLFQLFTMSTQEKSKDSAVPGKVQRILPE